MLAVDSLSKFRFSKTFDHKPAFLQSGSPTARTRACTRARTCIRSRIRARSRSRSRTRSHTR